MATVQALASFSPTQIANCAFWVDAADSNTVVLSGSNVTQWNDKSGNGRNASSFDSGNPQYNPTGFSGGLPTISFGSMASFRSAIASGTFSSGVSIFAAWYRTVSGSNAETIVTRANSGGYPGPWNINYESYPTRYLGDGAGGMNVLQSTTIPSPLNTPRVTSILLNGTISSWAEWANGTFYTFTSFYTQNTQAYVDNQSYVVIGNTLNKAAQLYGNISEIILYSGALSTSQRQQVEGYLAWKWRLQASLPASHPYYYFPPNSQNLGYPAGLRIPVPLQSFTSSPSPFIFFNPTTVPGCQFWLDGLDSSRFTLSGTTVNAWLDKSGNGNTFSRVSGSPSYSSNSVLFVSGNSDLLRTAASFIFSATTSVIFYVAQVIPNGNLNDMVSFPEFAGKSIRYGGTGGLVGTTSFGGDNNDFANSNYYVNGSLNPATTASIFTSSHIVSAINVNVIGSTRVQLSDDFFSRFFQGRIYEVLFYNQGVTTIQRQQIEGYLAWKWGLQGTLPSNHPFKNSPPGLTLPTPVPSTRLLQQTNFSPRNIPGIQLWLDAADNSTLTLGGANLTSWADKSGNGRNATPTGTVTYSANGFNSSYPTLSQTSGVLAASIPSNSMSNGMTGFSVMRPSGQTYYIGRPTIGSIPRPIDSFSLGVNRRLIGNGTQYWEVTMSGGYSFATVSNVIYNFQVLTSIQWVEWVNGSPSPVSGSVFNNGATYSDASTTLQIGVQGLNCEHIIYDGILNTTQRQQVEGYLAWKWGLQGSLPTNHPFKRVPPPPN